MARPLKIWVHFFIMGLLNKVIPFSLIFWGQTRIASSLASILNATTPVFTVVLAHFLTQDERLTANRLSGVLFGLVGVAATIGLDAMRGLGMNIVAQLAVLGAPLSYAFAAIYGRRFKSLSPLMTAAGTTNILLLTFLIPVSAILLGTTILGEQLEPRHFFGMGLIALGLTAIDGRPLAALRSLVKCPAPGLGKGDDYVI